MLPFDDAFLLVNEKLYDSFIFLVKANTIFVSLVNSKWSGELTKKTGQ